MNIKSLLLGSAAALVAVSGARAADAVVIAEPEPMEYVRICDTYGVGFYYIPGTETCLKVSGYFRYDIGVGDLSGIQDITDKKDLFTGDGFDTNDTYWKRARFQLRVDSRAETELGTLRTYAAINFNYAASREVLGGPIAIVTMDDSVGIEHAYMELGGFRVGKTDSLFSTFTGYAGGVIFDDIISYGPFGTNQIAYTFTGGNGFTAAVALEQGDGALIAPVGFPSFINLYTLDSYVPHVVGGVGYTAGWGGVSAVVGYDANWEEWAVKGRIDFNATDALSLFIMAGWASVDDDFFGGADSPNYYAGWGGDWAVWGGGTWKVNEKATINVQLSYDELEDFAAVANVQYELVNNFVITPEIQYFDNFDDDFDFDSAWGFQLRGQVNFGG
ncbi:porin [Mesorhizobium sp. KR9-304]|uniref:porin n=1 Tax=Mesorhizobium sp. KR9-304 TaxID=3156614 RepID=UPI0032B5CD90